MLSSPSRPPLDDRPGGEHVRGVKPPTSSPGETPPVRALDVAGLAAICALLLLVLTAVPPVFRRGEAREGLVVQSLLAGGSWIAPRREGRLASKPPLYHWLAACLAETLGASDFVLRIPSAVAGAGMLAATYSLGRTLFDRRRGWLAVGTLASTVGFWAPALEARLDMLFAALVAAALAGFAHWRRTGRPSARLVVYVASAGAVLTKGPAGALLPAAAIAAACLSQRDLESLRRLYATGPALLAAALVLGWYGLATLDAGTEFVATQILQENVARALGYGAFARQRGIHPLKLVESFVFWLLPWNLLLLGSWRRAPSWPGRLLHAWWITTFAIFTLAAGKRGVYLLPLYPAVALLAADRLHALSSARVGLAGGLALLATGMATANVLALRRQFAESPIAAFADAALGPLATGATAGARGPVSENDRLVLAYRAGRPLPRLDRSMPNPELLLIPAPLATRHEPHCQRLVEMPGSGADALVLMRCRPQA